MPNAGQPSTEPPIRRAAYQRDGYHGRWQPGLLYPNCNTVEHDGRMWESDCETSQEPGTGADWLRFPVDREKIAAMKAAISATTKAAAQATTAPHPGTTNQPVIAWSEDVGKPSVRDALRWYRNQFPADQRERKSAYWLGNSVEELAKTVIMVTDNLRAVRDGMGARITALEAQLAAVQARTFGYRGVFTAGETYEAGCFVTDHGGIWHCRRTTAERPGASNDWTLAVKAGRNGRDAKG